MGHREIGSAKVTAPDVSSFVIVRRRLLACLDDAFGGGEPHVVVMSAPAGFGKTTLVASWAREVRGRAAVAWCSLDTAEATPFRFWGLVLHALAGAGAELDATAPRRSGTSFPDRLAAHLSDHPDVVLVLDNVHVVRASHVVSDLDRFLAQMSGNARVVILTRSDPALPSLQRHRLAGRSTQLRTADLAFDRQETSQICPSLTTDQQDTAWRLTEGWPAVLRLYEMASRTTSATARLPEVVEADVALSDYLFGETLDALAPELQELLALAAVPVILPLDLAVELTGRNDVGGKLDEVARLTGLVSRWPGEEGDRPTYRFHPILRSHLSGRLALRDLAATARAHATAARYFLRAGLAGYAVEHAASSTDVDVLEMVLSECGAGLITAGEADLLLSVLHGSLRRGARSEAAAGRSWPGPWTYAVMAAADLDQGHDAEAAGFLARARTAAQASTGAGEQARAMDVMLTAAEVHLRRRRGEAMPDADLLADPPACINPELRLLLAVQRGTALMWRGDWDAAEHELSLGARLARGLGRDAALIDCLTGLASVHTAHSQVPRTREYVDEALWLARARGWDGTSRVAFTHVLASWVGWQELRPDAAREHMDAALSVLDVDADPTIVIAARALDAALVHAVDGTPESAARLHDVWTAYAGSEASPSLVAYAVLADARFSLGLHRVSWAHDAARLARERIPASGEVQLVEALVAESTGHHVRARQLLAPVVDGVTPTVVPSTRIEAHGVGARLALREGNTRTAVGHARSALDLVAASGCLRPLTDAGGPEVIELLRAERGRWGAREPLVQLMLERCDDAPPPSVDPLTSREQEILRELPSLRTVEEIGEALYLSPNTVKTHLRGIYRKLGVASRREAVIEGRRLGLL